jgi:hypothetical protein
MIRQELLSSFKVLLLWSYKIVLWSYKVVLWFCKWCWPNITKFWHSLSYLIMIVCESKDVLALWILPFKHELYSFINHQQSPFTTYFCAYCTVPGKLCFSVATGIDMYNEGFVNLMTIGIRNYEEITYSFYL